MWLLLLSTFMCWKASKQISFMFYYIPWLDECECAVKDVKHSADSAQACATFIAGRQTTVPIFFDMFAI